MGTGKSSTGQIIAGELHFRFIDTDQLIEERLGMSISDIFTRQGEAFFRRYESEIVKELAQERGAVISTGGGLAVNPDNMASLKTHALVVCLWASPEVIYERVRHQSHRPLLQTPDPLQKIRELLAAREPFYKQADILTQSASRPPRDLALQIVRNYELRIGAQKNAS